MPPAQCRVRPRFGPGSTCRVVSRRGGPINATPSPGAVAKVVESGGGVISGLFNEPQPALARRRRSRHGQNSTTADTDGRELLIGEAWFDPIEAGVRDRVRGFIEELLEQELT